MPVSVLGCVALADVVSATGATNGNTAAGGGSGVYTLIAPIGCRQRSRRRSCLREYAE
jgi:hypothetical protein